jgi:integrase
MDRKSITASFSQKSGKELAKAEPSDPSLREIGTRTKPPPRPTGGFGKSTSKYWESKVYRPIWRDEGGQRREVSNYFVRIMVSARREAIALNTADRSEAGRRAARLYERIRSLGWEVALRDFDPERHIPKSDLTVGHIVSALNEAVLRERTRFDYASALRWFAARYLGLETTKKTFGPQGSAAYRKEVESVRLADLTDGVVNGIIENHIKAAGENAEAGRSARISTASFLRNARAALSIARQKGVGLPEPRPFAGVLTPKNAEPARYTSTFDAARLLREAKKELERSPAAYIAILLALGAGLRRAEILHSRWRNLDEDRNWVVVRATASWQAKTGESECAVHVDPGLLKELGRFRAKPDDFVTTASALDDAVAWLRSKGIKAFKPLHTLRKEFGALINEQADLFTASRQLRHSNLSVTQAVYADNRKRVAPKIGEMLEPKRKRREK